MSSTPKSSSKSPLFVLDDVDHLLFSNSVKKEKGFTSPAPRPVTTRSKTIAHKRKKPSDPKDEFIEVEKGLIEYISNSLGMLKASHDKKIKESETHLANMRSILAEKDKVLARAEKEIKELKDDLQVAEDKAHLEVQFAIEEAKEWMAKQVIQARIKMAKDATDAAFKKVEWDMAKWKQTLANLGDEDQADDKVADEEASKDAEGDNDEKVQMGDEGVMQA